MTTIAANLTEMACDSKVSLGSLSFKSFKIIRKGKALIGTAGDCGPGNKFIEWFGTRRKRPKLEADDDFEALVLTHWASAAGPTLDAVPPRRCTTLDRTVRPDVNSAGTVAEPAQTLDNPWTCRDGRRGTASRPPVHRDHRSQQGISDGQRAR